MSASAGLNGALTIWILLMVSSQTGGTQTAQEQQVTPAPATAEAAPPAERGGPPAPQAVAAVTLPPPPRPKADLARVPEAEVVASLAPKPTTPRKTPELTPLRPKPEETASKDPVIEVTPLRPRPTSSAPVAPTHVPTMDVRTAEPPAAAPPEVVARGRTLLRLREHGAGPEIEIAWPDGARRRERLHLILTRCHGMQLGLMTPEGRLYRVEDPPGTAWEINLDRFSGFIREARGRLATAERREIGRLRRHHGLTGNAVRIFPRTVDAAFFGGLGRLTGTGYGSAKTIRAHYRLTADRVEVGDVLIDGRVVTGQLALPAVTRSCGQY